MNDVKKSQKYEMKEKEMKINMEEINEIKVIEWNY